MPKNVTKTKLVQKLNVWRAGMPDFLGKGAAKSVHIAGVTGSSPVSPTIISNTYAENTQGAVVQLNKVQRLHEAFICDHVNGVLYHRRTTRQASTTPTMTRRSSVRFEGDDWGTHRLIWEYVNGQEIPDGYVVDHIDRDHCNNAASNLRLATWAQNQANAKVRKDNTSGLKGVAFTKRGTYAANISINGKVKYLGSYKTPEEAHAVYLAKAKELRGQFVPEEGRHLP